MVKNGPKVKQICRTLQHWVSKRVHTPLVNGRSTISSMVCVSQSRLACVRGGDGCLALIIFVQSDCTQPTNQTTSPSLSPPSLFYVNQKKYRHWTQHPIPQQLRPLHQPTTKTTKTRLLGTWILEPSVLYSKVKFDYCVSAIKSSLRYDAMS